MESAVSPLRNASVHNVKEKRAIIDGRERKGAGLVDPMKIHGTMAAAAVANRPSSHHILIGGRHYPSGGGRTRGEVLHVWPAQQPAGAVNE